MIEKLMELYPEHIVKNPSRVSSPKKYVWFYTNQYELIGLPHEHLTTREQALLNVFLKRVPSEEIYYNNREKEWAAYLNEHPGAGIFSEENMMYRFYHFSLAFIPEDQQALTQTLRSAVSCERANVIWQSDLEGVVIAEEWKNQKCSDPELHSFLRAVEGDFMIDVRMYRAGQHQDFELAKKYFKRNTTAFSN